MNRDLVEMVEYAFGSIWTLELLLLLHREKNRLWSHDELVRELRSSDLVVRESVSRLVANGLAVTEGDGARYSSASPQQDRLVDQLAVAYRTKPTTVRRMIVQGSAEKLRSFSDAFRLKPE